jgi:exo-beta-1,3-glucanase (GH17 family)/cellulose synthase/poly-beta-1,6-N-acetylglucosamine synthase-like glycosyltransferase
MLEMKRASVLIGVAIAIFTVGFWALMNRPEEHPPWPRRIQGFSFSPMRADQSPISKHYPSVEQIDADLAMLAGKTNAIRTYTVENVLAKIPELARKHGINVALGGWLDTELEKNEREIEALIKVARANRNVVRVVVGNEVVLRGDLPTEQLLGYLDRVRAAVQVPVSTAEPWHVWLKHPRLAEHVDYLAVHMLPYWEGIHVDVAVDYIVNHIKELESAFPGKPIVIAEVGWPSNGRIRKGAVASSANEAIFLRQFLARAEQEKYTYYVMEAFDQPWKRVTEGAVGAYWGVYDVNREAKFPFSKPIVAIPQWHMLAGISVLIAIVTLTLLFIDSKTLRNRGRSFLAVIASGAATAAVWIVYDYLHRYLTVGSVLVGILVMLGMVGVIVVLLTEAHEWAEALWVRGRRRPFRRLTLPESALPMVSIHVPIHNEPPDMLVETLDALAALDYPDYEVIVVDNNTKDPGVWTPVEEHCNRLGPKFLFFHVDPLFGFKAGALNYALAHVNPRAQIVAVIDSDYTVSRFWLRDLVPQFSNPKTALVQAPQDYRDDRANAFKAMCYAEYRSFFFIGMITRNERNAIIQHGTMTMVRRSVLDEIGGWSEWCITEDAELGIRIFARGCDAVYIPESYGKGLMPDTFIDYKKQRFRWAYGAVQILRRHAAVLLGRRPSCLTHGQRYHFLAGWLPWLADSANLFFTFGALLWSLAMVIAPKRIDPPLIGFSFVPLAFVAFKLGKIIYVYRTRVEATMLQTMAAAVAGLALSHTIAKAVFLGFVTKDKPFLRTPKVADTEPLAKAIAAAREETLVLLALAGAMAGISIQQDLAALDLRLWMLVLLVQTLPYLACLVVSVISGLPALPARLSAKRRTPPYWQHEETAPQVGAESKLRARGARSWLR